jgi:hypothetical protein
MTLSNLSIESLKEAVEIKEQITALESRLSKILGGSGGAGTIPAPLSTAKKGRRKMSAAARAKIAAAQRARWAKAKGKSSSPAKAPAKKKRHLSPEGRARIVAALKKRWAAAK